jgi:dolichyl-phosphate-mannose--protein O-mannosyl transferase
MLVWPNSVVFDEFHFGKFAAAYCCNQQNIFDVHPPFVKIMIAKIANALSSSNGDFSFSEIGQLYGDYPYWAFRVLPAFMNALIPVLVLILVLQLGGLLPTALFAALALMLENALWIHGHIMNLDSTLIAAQLFCASALIWSYRHRMIGWQGFTGEILAATGAAVAINSKLTGLLVLSFPIAIAGREYLYRRDHSWRSRSSYIGRALFTICLFLGAAAILNYWAFQQHFELLTKPGPGDAFFRATGNLFQDIMDLNRIMIDRIASIDEKHPYASRWYEWPLMLRGIFYWDSGERVIYLLPNPIVWIGSSLGLVYVIYQLIKSPRIYLSVGIDAIALMVLFQLGAWLPFAAVSRTLFLYHYLTPMVFGVIASGLTLQRLGILDAHFDRKYFIFILALVLGFIVMMPVTHGLPYSDYQRVFWQLFPHWR